MRSVGFIGGGRVTRILVRGWAHAGTIPAAMVVHEPDDAAFKALGPWVRREQRGSLEAACASDVVFVALHPPQVAGALAAAASALRSDAILVSLAPKVTLADIAQAVGRPRIARVIPNAASIVGRGFNPVAFGPEFPEPARATLAGLFDPLGQFPEVAEAQLEGYAILTAMGPTYFWPQWQALREVARECGLPSDAADRALRAMILGSVAALLDGELEPAAVMELVPVQPLAEQMPAMVAAYHAVLPALHKKITPPAKTAAAGR